jgi:hypothetical protein
MLVIKRNGQKESLNLNKFHDMVAEVNRLFFITIDYIPTRFNFPFLFVCHY